MKAIRYSNFKKSPEFLNEPLIIVQCPNFNKAFCLVAEQGEIYSYERHVLEPGEKIEAYNHSFGEWIIINRGHFQISIGDKEETFDLRRQRHVNIIYIPRGQAHSLSAIKKISYHVIKES